MRIIYIIFLLVFCTNYSQVRKSIEAYRFQNPPEIDAKTMLENIVENHFPNIDFDLNFGRFCGFKMDFLGKAESSENVGPQRNLNSKKRDFPEGKCYLL